MTDPSEQLISIIVPVYRVEEYLDRCVKSILEQTHKSIEVILVDDGSPDSCGDMCDAWAERDARVRVIHQENGGLSVARNSGIDVARGEWLMFVDSDDWVFPTFCEVPLAHALEHDADIVVFECDMVDGNGVPYETQLYKMRCEGELSRVEALCALAREEVFEFAWNKLYRREIFSTVRFPPHRAIEDQICAYECFDEASRVFVTHEHLYSYLQRDDSLAHRDPVKAFEDVAENRDWACGFLAERCPEAASCMEVLAAKSEIRVLRMQHRRLFGKNRMQALRRRLLARDIRPDSLTKGELRDLSLLRVSGRLFAIEHGARTVVAKTLTALFGKRWEAWLHRPQHGKQ